MSTLGGGRIWTACREEMVETSRRTPRSAPEAICLAEWSAGASAKAGLTGQQPEAALTLVWGGIRCGFPVQLDRIVPWTDFMIINQRCPLVQGQSEL